MSADEAFWKRTSEVRLGCTVRLFERHRCGDVELDLRRLSLRDKRLVIPQSSAVEAQGPLKRRRQPERHLGGIADTGCDETAGVASVSRGCRPAETAVDHESHNR